MALFSIFQILSIITLSLYLVGVLNNILSDKENACEMTYMYEYPQFVKIKVPENDKYPQYGLYAYSEGKFTERARKMRFDGIPVLFLPGNSGSFKQVRSLASVALRKSIPLSKYGFRFDYFTVDFNDELSGLFGGVLEKQLSFSSHSIQTIFDLYNARNLGNRPKPESIIVIGHSLGGVIARALLTYPQNKDKINLIITLASPHESPVVSVDYLIKRFYNNIAEYWDLKNMNVSNLESISNYWNKKVFITIGGGDRDFLVPSALISSPHADIQALTTAIPGVWLSTDHLCIVWCKQLVLVLNRLLFSIIDPSTKQLSTNTSHIINMGKHFLKIGYSKNYTSYNTPVEFIPDANWYEDSRRQYVVKHDKITKTWYYMVRLIDLPENEAVTFQTIDLEDKEWLFGCQAKYVHGQHRVCLNGRHLSYFGRWAPSRAGKRRIATIDLRALRISYPHWTHVLLRISPTNKPVEVHVDIHSKGSRVIQGVLPSLYSMSRRVLIKETHPNILQYNISFPGLDMLYQAYLLHVEPLESCQTLTNHHAFAELTIPWGDGYENYHYFTETHKAPMRLKLLKGNTNATKYNGQNVNVALTFDPQCRYSVSISVSPYDMLGQFSRHYSSSLPAYLASILLLVLRHWAVSMKTKQNDGISFHSALCSEHVKPYYLLMSARLGPMLFLAVPALNSVASTLLIGPSASQNFLILPLLLYMVSLGLAHILGAVVWGCIIFSGQIAHRVILRIVSFGREGGGGRLWEWIAKEMQNVPGFCGFLLIAFGLGSCGAISLIIGASFYFILITKIYEDYLEDFVYKTLAKVAKTIGNKFKGKDEALKSEEKSVTEDQIVSEETKALESDKDSIEKSDEVTNKPSSEDENKDKDKKKANKIVKERKNTDSLLASLHFHFAMFFIWCLITILNIPTLITWAHNSKYNRVLELDPSFYTGIIMGACAFGLWQVDAPKSNIKFYDVIEKIVYFTAVMTVMIAPMSLYRLNYILCGVFAVITLHQVFSVKETENEVSEVVSDSGAIENNAEIKDNVENASVSAETNDAEQTPEQSLAFKKYLEEEEPYDRLDKLKTKLEST